MYEGEDRVTTTTQRLHLRLQRVRDFDSRHPLVWDVTPVLLLVPFGLAELNTWHRFAPNPSAPQWLTVLLVAALLLPLLWRRRAPLVVLCLSMAAGLVNAWAGTSIDLTMVMLIVLYGLALTRPLEPKLLGWLAALISAPSVVESLRWGTEFSQLWLGVVMTSAVAALAGIAVRTRRDYTRSLLARAAQLEVERDQQAQLAAVAERTRIAREMHDIIGHNLSVITGLADGGAYASARNPERATQALEAIGTTSRQALTELRRVLGVLHEDHPTADLAPQPTLGDLDTLVDGVREAGLPVRLTVTGPTAPLSPGRQLTVFRVVQESLTNTLKHAGRGATAKVTLTYGPDTLEVRTTDTGDGSRSAPSGGQGIRGMRERTHLYGGTLEAGSVPPPEGGWRVYLKLPLEDLNDMEDIPQ